MKKIKKSPFTDPMKGVRPGNIKTLKRSYIPGGKPGPAPDKNSDYWKEWRKIIREGGMGR